MHSHWTPNLTTEVEYTKAFAQNKVSKLEIPTQGYHLLNASISYEKQYPNWNYSITLQGQNLLDDKVYLHNTFLPYVPQMGKNFSLGFKVEF